jgi:hypothetical protein
MVSLLNKRVKKIKMLYLPVLEKHETKNFEKNKLKKVNT